MKSTYVEERILFITDCQDWHNNRSLSSSSAYIIHSWMKVSPKSLQPLRSLATLYHAFPATVLMSSNQRFIGRPWPLFDVRGLHFTIPDVHQLSACLATCPTQLHFSSAILLMTSTTSVRFLISSFGILPRILDLEHAALNCPLQSSKAIRTFFVRIIVSRPYVVTGITIDETSKTFHLTNCKN